MEASLVIPARNEAACIESVIRDVRSVFGGTIIVVDNGSTDGTAEVAATAGAVVVSEPAAGYGRACKAGLAALPAPAEIVIFIDGDGSDCPATIPALLAALEAGADLALAVRRGPDVVPGSIAPAARFGNWLSCACIAGLWGFRPHDLSPLKAIRVQALRELGLREATYGWTVEMIAAAAAMHLDVDEVETGYGRRSGGQSKVSGRFWPSLRAGVRILTTIARVWLRHASGARLGAFGGGIAAFLALAAFTAWLNLSAPASFGVNAAALMAAWPLLLVGTGLGALAGAVLRRPRAARRTV